MSPTPDAEPESYIPRKYRDTAPEPLDLALHRPLQRLDGEAPESHGGLAPLECFSAPPIHNPLRNVAVVLRALPHNEKTTLARALRTSVMRLNTWASLMLEGA
jgi:hypothetical protein